MVKQVSEHDQIVTAVLNQTFIISGCDPECLWPEDKLSSQIGLKADQIDTLVRQCARELGISANLRIPGADPSLRDIVDLLRASVEHLSKAA